MSTGKGSVITHAHSHSLLDAPFYPTSLFSRWINKVFVLTPYTQCCAAFGVTDQSKDRKSRFPARGKEIRSIVKLEEK